MQPHRPRFELAPAQNARWNWEAVALGLHFTRDAFGGAIRYYTNILHVDALWFLPDLFSLICIPIFYRRYVNDGRNGMAFCVVLYLLIALLNGYVFLETFSAMSSSLKMMIPIFVGFCFCERNFNDYKKLLTYISFIFYASLIGIFLSVYFSLPWVGYSYELFGLTRTAGRVWWSDTELRHPGFAAENTMAGFFVLLTYVITSIRKSILWCAVFGAIGVYATIVTTSKTSLLCLSLYLVCLFIVRVLPERARFGFVRSAALTSFIVILIPPVLIAVFSGVDLSTFNKTLFSMQDRINNSWQLPFVYLVEINPIALFTGCGIGCFNYPHQIFSNVSSFWVPVDNFYIGTYLMLGMPFVFFMWAVFCNTFSVTDIYKLSVLFVMNAFNLTVLSYGPASGLIMIGLAFSEIFRRSYAASAAVNGKRSSWRFTQRSTLPISRARHLRGIIV